MASQARSTDRFKEISIQLIVILVLIRKDVYADIAEYQMNDYCGDELSFISEWEEQLKLELDDNYIYGQQPDYYSSVTTTCETKLEAWYTTYPKLMFFFEHLNLDCDDGHLVFYDYESGSTAIQGLEYVCGSEKPSGVFATDSRYFRIKYVPERRQHIEDIFSIIITTFTDSDCPSYAHECKNSRCVNDDLACNGYDSCGDGSGCDLSTGAIVGIVIGCVAGLGLIVSIVVCCICCQRKSGRKPGTIQSPPQPAVSYTVPGQQGYSQAAYGMNQTGPYPTHQPQIATGPNNMTAYPTAPMAPNMATNQQYPYMPTNQQPADKDMGGPPAYDDLFKSTEQEAK